MGLARYRQQVMSAGTVTRSGNFAPSYTQAQPSVATRACAPTPNQASDEQIPQQSDAGAPHSPDAHRAHLPESEGQAASAPKGGRALGLILMSVSSVSNQSGAALGSMAFPVIGPVGVVAVRQFVTALVLVPWARPRFRQLRAEHWWPIVGLAVVFSVMNLCLYMAIDRVGLGLAVVLEFLGPLGVAIGTSRRRLDIVCALTAGAAVVILVGPGGSADVAGIALALVAAMGWASYILLNRTLGRRLPRLEGLAAASLVTTVGWIPVAVMWFSWHTPTAGALMLAVACGVLASAIPYANDMVALRRVPTHLFGIFTSVNPVVAAFAGWIMLHQVLGVTEWAAIALIVASNAVVASVGPRRVKRSHGLQRRHREQ